jgi:hypothetical protein
VKGKGTEMRVMEIVRLAGDRYDDGPEGKIIAVGGRRSSTITVKWDDGKITDHIARDLKLMFSPFSRAQV